MKKLELQNFGVVGMDTKEMNETGGGSIWGIVKEIGAFVGGAVSDFAHGVSAGYSEARIERIINSSQLIA